MPQAPSLWSDRCVPGCLFLRLSRDCLDDRRRDRLGVGRTRPASSCRNAPCNPTRGESTQQACQFVERDGRVEPAPKRPPTKAPCDSARGTAGIAGLGRRVKPAPALPERQAGTAEPPDISLAVAVSHAVSALASLTLRHGDPVPLR